MLNRVLNTYLDFPDIHVEAICSQIFKDYHYMRKRWVQTCFVKYQCGLHVFFQSNKKDYKKTVLLGVGKSAVIFW